MLYLPDTLPATTLVVTAPNSLQLAGRAATITASGLDAGESYTIRIGATQVATGTAPGGLLDRQVTLPTFASDRRATVVVTGSEANRTGSTTTPILINKRLASRLDKGRVGVGRRQGVTTTGLANGEAVTITYKGRRVSPSNAHANTSGVYSLVFRVGRNRGPKALKVTGQFPGRIATRTFWVTKR